MQEDREAETMRAEKKEALTMAEVVAMAAEEEETAVAMEATEAEAVEVAAPDSHPGQKFLPWQQGHK